jgi:hypothetical protein
MKLVGLGKAARPALHPFGTFHQFSSYRFFLLRVNKQEITIAITTPRSSISSTRVFVMMSASTNDHRKESPASERSNSPEHSDNDWVEEATNSAAMDSRVQPWKYIYRDAVDNTLEGGPDYMTVMSQGGQNIGSKLGKDTSLAA